VFDGLSAWASPAARPTLSCHPPCPPLAASELVRLSSARRFDADARRDTAPLSNRVEDVGIFSFDRAAKKIRFRQFHVEGFVVAYASSETSEKTLAFISESIENIPSGYRSKETYMIYTSKGDKQVSWFERLPAVSLQLLHSAGLSKQS
jgi:hypothetical protein